MRLAPFVSPASLLRAGAPLVALSLATLPLTARPAADCAVPPGFNFETRPLPGSVAGVLADGTVLLSTGSFGADELSRLRPDGTASLYAIGFGSLAGLAQSPLTGRLVVGDSSPAGLFVLEDLNGDGDCLDPFENEPFGTPLPTLSNGQVLLPEGLAFRPGTDDLYVKGTTTFLHPPVLGAIVRFAGGSVSTFADGTGYGGGLVFDGDVLYAADLSASTSIGRVLALEDADGDGDALDPGEARDFASGLSGASGLARAKDGALYLSGTFDPSYVGTVTRLAPDTDGDGLSDAVDQEWASGFAFASGLVLVEGSVGLVPGAAGDGTLFVGDYSVAGTRLVRSAPTAELSLSGSVTNDSIFSLQVAGEPGATPVVVMALDTAGPTLYGIGDLCVGFTLPYIVLNPPALGPSGASSIDVPLHGVGGAVGTAFRCQAFSLLGGDVGLGSTLDLVIGS